jgi:hypothetical protein
MRERRWRTLSTACSCFLCEMCIGSPRSEKEPTSFQQRKQDGNQQQTREHTAMQQHQRGDLAEFRIISSGAMHCVAALGSTPCSVRPPLSGHKQKCQSCDVIVQDLTPNTIFWSPHIIEKKNVVPAAPIIFEGVFPRSRSRAEMKGVARHATPAILSRKLNVLSAESATFPPWLCATMMCMASGHSCSPS